MSKSFFNHLLAPRNLFFYLLIAYLVYHLLLSNKGIIAYFDLKNQLDANQHMLEQLERKHHNITIDVDALNIQSPSADMMDEQVKTKLNLIRKDEILLINDEIL